MEAEAQMIENIGSNNGCLERIVLLLNKIDSKVGCREATGLSAGPKKGNS